MNKLKTFLNTYVKSITSVAYYNDVVKAPVGFSIKYYMVLVFIITLVGSVFISFSLTPKAVAGINEFVDQAVKVYPDDLIISVVKGNLAINKPEPYIVPVPGSSATLPTESKGPANLIVFSSKGTIEDLKKFDTMFLVNSKNILFNDSRKGRIQAVPLDEMLADAPDGSFGKSTILKLVDEGRPYIDMYVPGFILVAGIIGLISYLYVYRMLYLLVVAVVLSIAGGFKKLDLAFGKYYQIALHSMTLPLTLEMVSLAVGLPITINRWFFVLNVVFGLIALFAVAENKANKKEEVLEGEKIV